MNILVVEDAAEVAFLLELVLTRHNSTDRVVVRTERFADIRDEIDWQNVDVIVCDRMLDNYDGAELLEWLEHHHPRIRRVMLTGSSSPGEAEVHAHKVLIKPVDHQVLAQAVRADD